MRFTATYTQLETSQPANFNFSNLGSQWNFNWLTYIIDDPSNPINACFKGQEYEIQDEIYTFKDRYSRDKLRILASIELDKSRITKGENRADHDYAVSWVQNFGKGRVFYCSLGHRNETYFNPVIMQHYLAGLQFALGDLPASADPSPKK